MSLLKPSEAIRCKILGELDITENRLNDDVNKLKLWLSKQPHLPQDVGDDLLQSFVTGTKGLEIAKEKLDRYFSVRNAFPNVFADRDPKKFVKPEAIEQFILPHHTKDGHAVFMLRVAPNSADDFDHLSVVKRQLLITDYMISKGMLCTGYVAVYDVGGTTMAHMTKFNLSYNATALKCYQDNYPIRIKKVILLNAPSFVIKTYDNLIKPLMKPKFAQKFVFLATGDKKSLFDHIQEDFVPQELGGKGPTCKELNENMLNTFEKDREVFLTIQQQRSNESKRIGKSKHDFDQNYGVEGTFRSLTLD